MCGAPWTGLAWPGCQTSAAIGITAVRIGGQQMTPIGFSGAFALRRASSPDAAAATAVAHAARRSVRRSGTRAGVEIGVERVA